MEQFKGTVVTLHLCHARVGVGTCLNILQNVHNAGQNKRNMIVTGKQSHYI